MLIELESATYKEDQDVDLKGLMKEMANQFFETMADDIPTKSIPFGLRCYLEGALRLKVTKAVEGSLRITVECSTLEILEGLWEDYCSGHLNAVAEENLLTDDIKRRLHVKSIALKTIVLEEDYLVCKQFLKGTLLQLNFVGCLTTKILKIFIWLTVLQPSHSKCVEPLEKRRKCCRRVRVSLSCGNRRRSSKGIH